MKRKIPSLRRAAVLLFPLSLFAVASLTAGASAAAPRLPSLSISAPASIVEGVTTNASFQVRLSGRSRKPVSVRFRTRGFFATQGADYRQTSGTLVFKPGQRTRQIVVAILDDTVAEDVEDFAVQLSRPHNARLRVAQAIGRIAPNDLPPPFSVTADLKAGQGPATGRAAITLDAARAEVRFTLEVHNSPRDPVAAHIHSRSMALQGAYPVLRPVPGRDGVASGAVQVAPKVILAIDANLPDFFVEVHVGPDPNSAPGDLVGDLHRAP
jgi:hypothetical protein